MTLHRAFLEAGLNSCHQRVSGDMPPLAIQICRAYQEDRNPLYYVPRGVDAITDAQLTRDKKWDGQSYWPLFIPGLLREIRKHNPDTWICLNTRNPEQWVVSIRRWKDLYGRMAKADLPFLPPGLGGTDEELVQWIEGHNDRVRALFKGDKYFLEVAIEDPQTPRKLEKALGKKLPWWGVMNANPETPDED